MKRSQSIARSHWIHHRKCAQGNFFCGSVLQSIGVMTITILRVSRMYLIWSLEEVVATKT
jgi:hypothetical protein